MSERRREAKSGGICFGCGRRNPCGLKLRFRRDGDWLRAHFTPTGVHQGWPDIIHGGIITTVLDEAMGHAALAGGFFDFLTASVQVDFRRPVHVDDAQTVSARIIKNEGRNIEVEGVIALPDGTVVAEGRAVQVLRGSGKLEAVIWDMDGVIAHTAPYHFQAWQETFERRKVPYSEAVFRRNFGRRNDTIIRDIVGEGITEEEVQAIMVEKEGLFRQKAAGKLTPLPGALELIDTLRDYGAKTALASSSPIENGEFVTRQLGIEDRFDAIVWGREVAEGKPSPQIFQLAARKLGAEAGNCVVIEDAVAGVAAAKNAGMKCVAVTTNHPAEKLGEADLVVESLEDVGVADVAGLVITPLQD